MNCVLVRQGLSLASHKGAACETIVNFKFTLLWGCTTINDKEMWDKSPRTKLATLQVYFVAGLTNLVLDSKSSEELLYVLLHNRETTVTFPDRLECILSTCAVGRGCLNLCLNLCLNRGHVAWT